MNLPTFFIDIVTEFIPLSLLTIISMIFMLKAASDFEKMLCGEMVKRTLGKHG